MFYPTCVWWILNINSLGGGQVTLMPLHNSVDEKYEYIHYNKNSHKKGQVVVLNFLQKLRM